MKSNVLTTATYCLIFCKEKTTTFACLPLSECCGFSYELSRFTDYNMHSTSVQLIPTNNPEILVL